MPVQHPPLLAVLCAALGAACSGTSPALDSTVADLAKTADQSRPGLDLGGPQKWEPPVACGSLLPGPPLKAGTTEAQPGYAAELAALDLSAVPDPFDYASDSKFVIATINYMLGRSSGTQVSRAELAQAAGLGQAILGAAAKGTPGRVDISFLRRGLYYFYLCTRPLPRDLNELAVRYGDYRTWPAQELPCSPPKNGPRRLYENPASGIYVSETLTDSGVRETEALFTSLRQDGQLDFAAYTADGALSDRSSFATGSGAVATSAAPYTCMSCHADPASGTVSRRIATGTGAGCR